MPVGFLDGGILSAQPLVAVNGSLPDGTASVPEKARAMTNNSFSDSQGRVDFVYVVVGCTAALQDLMQYLSNECNVSPIPVPGVASVIAYLPADQQGNALTNDSFVNVYGDNRGYRVVQIPFDAFMHLEVLHQNDGVGSCVLMVSMDDDQRFVGRSFGFRPVGDLSGEDTQFGSISN